MTERKSNSESNSKNESNSNNELNVSNSGEDINMTERNSNNECNIDSKSVQKTSKESVIKNKDANSSSNSTNESSFYGCYSTDVTKSSKHDHNLRYDMTNDNSDNSDSSDNSDNSDSSDNLDNSVMLSRVGNSGVDNFGDFDFQLFSNGELPLDNDTEMLDVSN